MNHSSVLFWANKVRGKSVPSAFGASRIVPDLLVLNTLDHLAPTLDPNRLKNDPGKKKKTYITNPSLYALMRAIMVRDNSLKGIEV